MAEDLVLPRGLLGLRDDVHLQRAYRRGEILNGIQDLLPDADICTHGLYHDGGAIEVRLEGRVAHVLVDADCRKVAVAYGYAPVACGDESSAWEPWGDSAREALRMLLVGDA